MARSADPERSAARRQEITRAAAALFAQQGFDNTSTAEIARAAGLSSGSIFYYFADKRAVLRSVFEPDLPDTRELVERCLAGEEPIASILELVDGLAGEAMNPLAPGILVETLRQAPRDAELARIIGDTAAIAEGGFTALIERGIASGAIDPALEPAETARWIQVVIDGAFVNADPEHDPRPMLHRIITRFLARPAGGRP